MTDGSPDDRTATGGDDGGGTNGGAELGSVLRELKADGCNLLVVGDAPRRLFTEASGSFLGGADERRYRLLAVTDASPRSVVERLPTADGTSDPSAETTEIINHASPPRSVANAGGGAGPGSVGELPERRVVDPQLGGLQAELAEAMAAFDRRAGGLDPAQLRVGVDSLGALLEHYEEGVVERCLQVVTGYVSDYDAMGHYVLVESFEAERVQSLVDQFDAVVQLRAVDSARHDHHAEERWHVPTRGLETDWLPL